MLASRAIRVLYVDNTFTFGGAINALGHLVGALDQHLVEPVVLSAQSPEVLAERFPETRTIVWPMRPHWADDRAEPAPTGPIALARSKASTLKRLAGSELPEALRLRRLIRAEGVDLVHLNNGVEGLLAPLVAAKLAGIPVVAHSRGGTGKTGLTRRYVRMADRWIAVSGTMADDLVEAGADRARITVVHDAIDFRGFERTRPPGAVRAELGVPPDAPVFALFGRIIPWKGVREFVLASAEVIRQVPNARALVVGGHSDGSPEYLREVRALAEQLGLGERVLFTGFRPDIPDVMRACDVIVHSSIVPEPFGMTVIEGMAVERPVVAASSGGPTEIIRHGETGILADPLDPPVFGRAIVQVLRDPELASRLARAATTRVRAHYTAERYARDVEGVYREMGILRREGPTPASSA